MNRRGFLRMLGLAPVAMVAVPAIAIGSVQRLQSGADSLVVDGTITADRISVQACHAERLRAELPKIVVKIVRDAQARRIL